MNFEYDNRNDTWNRQMGGNSPAHKKCCDPKYKKTIICLTIIVAIIGITILGYLVLGGNGTIQRQADIKTLKQASILFRHGARTPSGSYNSDPYKDYNWPGGWGALTNEGKLQLYNLGKTLRKRYAGFLPDDYSDDDVYIKCSDRSRTLMSAYTLLAGLYPPTKKQTWNPDILWQPIPVHSLPREIDAILAAKQDCPAYDKHFEEVKNSPELIKINEQNKDLYDNLTLYCNQTMDSLLAVELLYSHLEIQRDNGLVLPEWTKGIFPEKMIGIPGLSLALFTYDDILMRFRGGPLLSEIIDNMKNKVAETLNPDRKLFLYSAHDLTIVNLWRTLTFKEIILPKFGAALVIELHEMEDDDDTEIKLLYYNSSSTVEPYKLTMPSCSNPCSLTEFEKLVENHIPLDWNAECQI